MLVYLCVIAADTGAASPCADTDVSLSIGEAADELLQLWVIFDGVNACNVALWAGMNAFLEAFLLCLARFVPGGVQLLHEQRIAFTSGWLANLLNGHITTSADNIAQIDEVVACMHG